jgi:zinc transport system substrate-binding protein
VRALALVLTLTACRTGSPETAGSGPIQVAVSVAPQAYFVDRIGGRHVRVAVMIPPGYSHVDYPLTPWKVIALQEARLYIKVGHPGFEFESHFLDPYLAERRNLRVVDMSRGMDLIGDEAGDAADEEGHVHGGGDPHVWVAPESVRVAAGNIAAALIDLDPAHAGEYRENLRRFLADIDRLDREIRTRLAGRQGEAFMVYHPEWGYFAREYGLRQLAIESSGKEPSARRLIQLIEEARREKVKVVFIQGGFPRKSAQVIADAVGARVVTADPQREDWLDNLRRVSAELGEALPRA